MHLTPNMYKNINLKANAKEIITLKCFWYQICTKCYFEGKCSENAFGTKYVQNGYFKGKC